MKLQLVSCDVIGTKDAEYMQLEKVFNEFTKLVDVLAQDARIFRDSIAGKTRFWNLIFLGNSTCFDW